MLPRSTFVFAAALSPGGRGAGAFPIWLCCKSRVALGILGRGGREEPKGGEGGGGRNGGSILWTSVFQAPQFPTFRTPRSEKEHFFKHMGFLHRILFEKIFLLKSGPSTKRQRQDALCEFKVSQRDIVRSCLKNKQTNQNKTNIENLHEI